MHFTFRQSQSATETNKKVEKNATYRLSHSLEGEKWDRTTETGLDAWTPALRLPPPHYMLPAVPNGSW